MKIALIHEWLIEYAGSERVFEKLIEIFPESDLFAVIDFLPKKNRAMFKGKKIKTTFIQKLPFAKTSYKNYLPLMPIAIEQLDVSNYDLIISSSHAVAKGILTSPNQIHICMCYSPMRYAWDLQHQYLKESNLEKGLKSLIVRYFLHKIRIWDYRTASGVDYFIAISDFISKRIKKIYGKESFIIYPPVEIDKFTLEEKKEDFYLTASRLVPYKKVDLIARAFLNMPDKKLYLIGDGSEYNKIKNIIRDAKNIYMLGYQDDKTMIEYMKKAKAFIYCAEEDFGIVPLEAQACGTPVIAYGKGGLKETIIDLKQEKPTGIFFYKQEVESLIEAIKIFEANQEKFIPKNCRENALRFSPEIFKENVSNFIKKINNII
ncbi:MAG: glycosyltransferase family 4 protein [Candidatus Sericytochromatia bacterium]